MRAPHPCDPPRGISVASVGEHALREGAIGVHWQVPGGELQRHQLIESAGKLKVDSCVLIHLRCRGKVELVCRDFAGVLVADEKRCPGENVVMNLLRGAAVFEDERDRFHAFRDWGRLRPIGRRRVRHTRPRLLLGSGVRIVAIRPIGALGSGVR